MKKLLLISLLFALNVQASIHELASYKNLDLSQIDQNTLVIFDIDNTLLRQDSMIGTHQWGDYIKERAIRRGVSATAAAELQHKLFGSLQPYVKAIPVESEIHGILKHLTEKGIPHFALTARGQAIQDVTLKQIKVLNHAFAFPEQKDLSKLDGYLREGIIFSGSTPKGELLKLILENSVHKPTKVIFVDDRGYNLDSVELSLKDYPVELTSYRYGGADNFVKNFDPRLADLIYSFFIEYHTLLTNAEAFQLVGHLPEINEKRFEIYLTNSGPLSSGFADSCEVSASSVLVYECDYLYDNNILSYITFTYQKDDFTNSIYFGNW